MSCDWYNNCVKTITPHLWFDTQALEAVEFYLSAFKDFPGTAMTHKSVLHDTPSGDAQTVSFTIAGHPFMAISAGPYFTLNPAISFMVNFDPSRDTQAVERLDALWAVLSDGGIPLMPLGEYPFSKKYGWIQDKYGVSWQLIFTNPAGEPRPVIIPSLLFTKGVSGKAEEALNFYASVFKDSRMGTVARFPADTEHQKAGDAMFAEANLSGTWIAAMDGGAAPHDFAFNEAVSLIVPCETQEEVDHFWEKLSAVPASEQCGWLKDKYGVSWQIVPTAMEEMMQNGTPEQIAHVTQAFLQMKKFDIAALRAAYEGA